MAAQVPLTELRVSRRSSSAILESAGYRTLNDILDLEREDIAKIPGMTPEAADQLMASWPSSPRRRRRGGRAADAA